MNCRYICRHLVLHTNSKLQSPHRNIFCFIAVFMLHIPYIFLQSIYWPTNALFFFSWRYNPWWVLACFTISFHNLYTSLSSFSLSSSLNPLLLAPAISVLVFLLVLMNMVPIQLICWQFLLYPFWLHVVPNVIKCTQWNEIKYES